MRILTVLLLATALASGAQAQDFDDDREKFGIDPNASFSGTRHVESKDGQVDMFFRQAPDKMRMDMTMAGQTMTVITRSDLGLNYMLMHQMRTYRVVKANEVMAGGANLSFSEVSEAGRETVSDYPCTKYRAQFTDAEGGRAGGYYWVSDAGILMKVDMIYQSRGKKGERLVFTIRDLQIGEQDPSYFELPSDYSKLGFGMAISQMQAGQPPTADEPTLADSVEDAASDEAKQTVIGETRKSIRKGLGKLFGRD